MGVFTKKPRQGSQGSTWAGDTALANENKSAQATDSPLPNDGESQAERFAQGDPDHPTEDAQAGVQEVEAVTLSWTKASLIAVFLKYVHLPPNHHVLLPLRHRP